MAREDSPTHETRWKRIIVVTLSIVVAGIVTVVVVVAVAIASWFNNVAQDAVAPIDRDVVALGGQPICSNGDAGKFINREPWYYTYYLFDEADGAVSDVRSIVRDHGYLQYASPSYSEGTETHEYFSYPGDERTLTIVVADPPNVTLHCEENWGEVQPIDKGQIVIRIGTHFPRTD